MKKLPRTTVLTIRIATELKREVKKRAKRQKITPSAYAARIIEFQLKGVA